MIKDIRIIAGVIALAAMLVAGPAAADRKAGDIIGRIGLTNVDPKQDNGDLNLAQAGLGKYQIDVDDDTQVGVTGVYMFTDNIGIELLAALPFEHDISVAGTQIGSTKHLPPTLSLQYHFNSQGDIHPYIGAGLNYTTFFDEDGNGADPGGILGGAGLTGVGVADWELDDSWGLALQAGVDFEINERTMINFDVRWIDIDSDIESVKLTNGIKLTEGLGEAEIDPIIISLMLGYKF
ncbi:MAG: OmpW/AlkL family protein [Gammaproteobacteria bacterium]